MGRVSVSYAERRRLERIIAALQELQQCGASGDRAETAVQGRSPVFGHDTQRFKNR